MPSRDLSVIWSIAWIAIIYFSYKLYLKKRQPVAGYAAPGVLSSVSLCIQIPIFNEPHHAVDCLLAFAQINSNRSDFEIQVLDDSTDRTSALLSAEISRIAFDQPDLKIKHLQRHQRTGYKAGALNEELKANFSSLCCDILLRFPPGSGFSAETHATHCR